MRDLRAAFVQTSPDRHVTAAVEEQIADDTRTMRACLDEVAARVAISATSGMAGAFGQKGAAPWLADIAKRKAGAEKEVRAYFVEAGYRRSHAAPKPSTGFFYCEIKYRDPAGSDGAGMVHARFVSRIMPDPSLRSDAAPNMVTKVQLRFLANFRTWVNANHIIKGVRPSVYEADPSCISRPTFAALRDLREGTVAPNTPGTAFGD